MTKSPTNISTYFDAEKITKSVEEGRHREIIGGMWDEIGLLQFEMMREQGLRPQHKLLDIGCGPLRGGVNFVGYLDAGNYFGIDFNQSLLDAGYNAELTDADREKLPRENLKCGSDFNFGVFDEKFDYAIALSVFTHLSLNHIRACLERLTEVMQPGGTFIASFFEIPAEAPSWTDCTHQPGGVITHAFSAPYHYRVSDFQDLCKSMPWTIHYIGDAGHPRAQKMILFKRDADSPKPQATESSETRDLDHESVAALPAGADHYRAYVGPPGRFDFMSATQFSLLFQLGMREDHTVLDFGCGSLRLGRLLIPFLRPGGYHGIDPNAWLIDDALSHEIGRDIVKIKSPSFGYNDNFDCAVFGKQFDFIMAQSIITHTGPDLAEPFFVSASKALKQDGIVLFSYFKNDGTAELPENGWHYPECVGYSEAQIMKIVNGAGMAGKPLPWYHPVHAWLVAGKTMEALPVDDHLHHLTGAVLRAEQFKGSLTLKQ